MLLVPTESKGPLTVIDMTEIRRAAKAAGYRLAATQVDDLIQRVPGTTAHDVSVFLRAGADLQERAVPDGPIPVLLDEAPALLDHPVLGPELMRLALQRHALQQRTAPGFVPPDQWAARLMGPAARSGKTSADDLAQEVRQLVQADLLACFRRNLAAYGTLPGGFPDAQQLERIVLLPVADVLKRAVIATEKAARENALQHTTPKDVWLAGLADLRDLQQAQQDRLDAQEGLLAAYRRNHTDTQED